MEGKQPRSKSRDPSTAENWSGKPAQSYVCDLCHIPGHWIRDCPTRVRAKSPYSHKPRESTPEGKPPSEGYVCHKCDKPGHWIHDCPLKRGRSNSPHPHKPQERSNSPHSHKPREGGPEVFNIKLPEILPKSNHSDSWSRQHGREFLVKFRWMAEEFLKAKKISVKGELDAIIKEAYRNNHITIKERDNLHILRIAGNVGSHLEPFTAWKEGKSDPKVRPGLEAARALGLSDQSISKCIEETLSSVSESESQMHSLLRMTRDINIAASSPPPTKPKGPSDSFLRSLNLAESSEEEESTVVADEQPFSKEDLVQRIPSILLKKHENIDKAVKYMVRAHKISICFLLDTTQSMKPYIDGVKEQIGVMVTKAKEAGCTIAGLAFVGYKDWCCGRDHFEISPFSSDVDEFKAFVGRVGVSHLPQCKETNVPRDYPEDVLGGMLKAAQLSWPADSGVRIIHHFADDCPHGTIYHGDYKARYIDSDSFPSGHPDDPTLDSLFKQLKAKNIIYKFMKVNEHCARMVEIFSIHTNDPIEVYNTEDISTLTDSIEESIRASVTTALESANVKKTYVKLSDTIPDWTKVSPRRALIDTYELPDSIKMITKWKDLQLNTVSGNFQIAPEPFARGAQRKAFFARRLFPLKDGEGQAAKVPGEFKFATKCDDIVAKEFITKYSEKRNLAKSLSDMETQAISKYLALLFNHNLSRKRVSNDTPRIKVLLSRVVKFFPDGQEPSIMSVEQKFKGDSPVFEKYTNNLAFVRQKVADQEYTTRLDVALAFSHFSFQITSEYLIVVDLQGVVGSDSWKKHKTIVLTDTAIHCQADITRFGKTNLGQKGMDTFMSIHKCNALCKALGLDKPKADLIMALPATPPDEKFDACPIQ